MGGDAHRLRRRWRQQRAGAGAITVNNATAITTSAAATVTCTVTVTSGAATVTRTVAITSGAVTTTVPSNRRRR